MKYMTSGDIHRMFKQEDEGTIIRRNNVRRIALENGIKNTLTQNIILIDSKDFFEKVNPYDLQDHEYKIPKLNIDKLTDEEPDKFILRAHADGKPEYFEKTIGGTTYKAVKVGEKIYIPNN